MVPMAASAEEAEGNDQQTTYAVKIGEKQYETLAAALEEAKDGDTLTLLKDIVLDATGVGNNQGVLTLTKDITPGRRHPHHQRGKLHRPGGKLFQTWPAWSTWKAVQLSP